MPKALDPYHAPLPCLIILVGGENVLRHRPRAPASLAGVPEDMHTHSVRSVQPSFVVYGHRSLRQIAQAVRVASPVVRGVLTLFHDILPKVVEQRVVASTPLKFPDHVPCFCPWCTLYNFLFQTVMVWRAHTQRLQIDFPQKHHQPGSSREDSCRNIRQACGVRMAFGKEADHRHLTFHFP
ncbi:unnamed protein product [Trypanosoma congolense IL3000]|uniref:WGS project CAEQ00000000 data, annotated contig 930 n=1 Tax=Trypanosoma congolense (strain IL3000) TaxID=1068625 RepID=F9WJM7_TRYCI|nr:unnamed protein product [Trypanosoma congolense IL3000]